MAVPLILLVDDTRLFLSLEKEFLRQSAVRVITAGDGRQALELAREKRPDLIYLDVTMPEMDGIECCRRLREDPATAGIPVVMVTTRSEEEDACRTAGCSEFLTKPLNRRLFLEIARKHLGDISRHDRRVPLEREVDFRLDGVPLRGRTVDLSDRGMYIACDLVGSCTDETVEITLALPEGPVRLTGRVAWMNGRRARRKPALPAGFGVEFLQVPEGFSSIIAPLHGAAGAGS
ncbi:MAG TPA: response regulator [Verrucomicrobiae bacterium]|nr:response regulator [Verrucomicrobiae bacterium]